MRLPQQQYNPTNILLIDNSPFMRSILRGILEMGGYRIIAECNGGVEAIDSYLHYRPDITILDAAMRGHSGLEVASAILAQDDTASIVITDFDSAESSLRAEAIGACGVLVKPYSAEQVLTVMQVVQEGIRLLR